MLKWFCESYPGICGTKGRSRHGHAGLLTESFLMEGPARAREHRAGRVITTLVSPDPHSQELAPLSSSSSSVRTLIVQFFSGDLEVLGI